MFKRPFKKGRKISAGHNPSKRQAVQASESSNLSCKCQDLRRGCMKRTYRGGERMRRSIRFGDVRVREFERVVGDNPSCSSGAPVRYVDAMLRLS